MPHFLIKATDIKENKITISDKDLYKHIIKVMRTKSGEKLLFLQKFVDSGQCLKGGLREIPKSQAIEFQNILSKSISVFILP